MTLCEKCIHGEICADRGWMDEGDERALVECCNFKNKEDFVEVKHGEWIDRDESYWETRCTCSNCNKDGITIDGYPVHTDYCPNCGAKMDGDK